MSEPVKQPLQARTNSIYFKFGVSIFLAQLIVLAIVGYLYLFVFTVFVDAHLRVVNVPSTTLESVAMGRRDIILILLLGGVLVLVVTMAAGYILFQRLIRTRLKDILSVLRAMEQDDLNARVMGPFNGDEISVLGQRVNAVMEKRATAEQDIKLLNEELREFNLHLEKHVMARIRDLETAADVSKQLTQVLELEVLMQQVVGLITKNFNLYYSTIFLLDPSGKTLTRAANADSHGNSVQEINMEFSIDARPSLVAQAARTREAVVVNNVAESPDHFPQPSLPETHSEAAIPIMLGHELVGVLDLQSQQLNFFGSDELRVLTILADGIAVAAQNAQLFEEVISAHAQAERANLAKTQFLASVSHELRTPLNGIMNFTRFVMDGVVGAVNERQADLLNKVLTNSNHLLALINDVLDISRIESGSMKFFVEANVDINGLLSEVLDEIPLSLRDKPVELVRGEIPVLPVATVDRRRIRQILLNIFSNACKFTQKGQIKVDACIMDKNIRISVADTGPGILAEEKDAVFEPFQQTSVGVRTGGGTGLGMAISRRLARAHGGDLWFESVIGEGSTFHLLIPIQSPILKPAVVSKDA